MDSDLILDILLLVDLVPMLLELGLVAEVTRAAGALEAVLMQMGLEVRDRTGGPIVGLIANLADIERHTVELVG